METNIISYIAIISSILGVVLGIINHKKFRLTSRCCGKVETIEASIDVGNSTNSTPQNEKPLLKINTLMKDDDSPPLQQSFTKDSESDKK